MKTTLLFLSCLMITALAVNIKKSQPNPIQSGNLINNGDFSLPNFNGHWGFISPPNGWEIIYGEMEVGSGTIYNPNWKNWKGKSYVQVAEIDGNKNDILGAHVILEAATSCTVEFDYAERVNSTNGLSVYWNDTLLLNYSNQSDLSIKQLKQSVKGKVGDNLLKFVGTAKSDSYGMTFTNVSVTCDKKDC